MNMKVLVTGAAGFIGSRLLTYLSERGDDVVGIDNLNDYYDVRMKYGRLADNGFPTEMREGLFYKSDRFGSCRFVRMSICDKESLDRLFENERFDKVVNYAAQPGVRHSITDPYSYLENNLYGFLNVLEACRNYGVGHLLFASSSSVYGLNESVPFSEEDRTEKPASLYGATKKADELMAYAYSKLYGFATTGLRYFTVYGPWGRPDMSPMLFASAISKGEPIKVFNDGDMVRDFTYIDDAVEATMKILDGFRIDGTEVPSRIYNIGCSSPVSLMDFISEIEKAEGKVAEKVFLPMQPGDILETFADMSRMKEEFGFMPRIGIDEGVRLFMDWFNSERNPLV